MLLLKIKQAEAALADGRLEECRGMLSGSLRKHRRGQALTGRLARAFAARGHEHLEAGRIEQAARDGQASAELGTGLPETAALQTAARRAMENAQQASTRDARRMSHARELLRNGRFSDAERLLGEVGNADRADSLRHRALRKRASVDDGRGRIERALEADDVGAALDALRSADPHDLRGPLADVAAQARSLACKAAEDALRGGRPDASEGIAARLSEIFPADLAVNDLTHTCRQCRQAAMYLYEGRADRAREILGRLSATATGVEWIDRAHTESEQVATSLRALRAGPLGLLLGTKVGECGASGRGSAIPRRHGKVTAADAPRAPQPSWSNGSLFLPHRFILQIDGAGSYLVLRSRCVTVGALSTTPRPTLRLQAHAGIPIVCLERSDDDYLLLAERPVDVAGSPTTRCLLADGHTMAIQGSYKLRFGRPNAASGTALLTPTGVRLADEEATHVLLMDRDILIGGGRANHIRVRGVDGRITLFLRDGGLRVRASQPAEANGRQIERDEPLPIHVSIRVGNLSFVLKESEEEPPVDRAQANEDGR